LNCSKRAFTLFELLIVLVIVALLVALISGVVLRTKQSSTRTNCTQSLRQVGLAILMYAETNGSYPRIDLDPLVQEGLVTVSLLHCKDDPFEGFGSKAWACKTPHLRSTVFHASFESPLHYQGTRIWDALGDADSNHGILTCRLHGDKTVDYGRDQNFCKWAMMAYEGKLLRLRKDGSVQQAKLQFASVGKTVHFSPWRLWTDEPEPDWWPGLN